MHVRPWLLTAAIVLLAAACSSASTDTTDPSATTRPEPARVICDADLPQRLVAAADELAVGTQAMVASRKHPGLLWVLTVEAAGPQLVALMADGRVAGSISLDLDIQADPGEVSIGPGPDPSIDYLYVADLGDDDTVRLVRLVEPDPEGIEGVLEAETLDFSYDGRSHTPQGAFVDPATGDLHVVAGSLDGLTLLGAEAPLASESQELAPIARIGTSGSRASILSADIAGDGTRIVLLSEDRVALWKRDPGQPIPETLVSPPCSGFLTAPSDGVVAVTAEDAPLLYLGRGRLQELAVPQSYGPQDGLPGDLAGTVEIVAPDPDSRWLPGDVVELEATASDDAAIQDGGFRWDVTAVTCLEGEPCQRRPVATIRSATGRFTVPEDLTLPVFLEITSSYTDSAELSDADQLRLDPQTTSLQMDSMPPGIEVTVGQTTVSTPGRVEVITGSSVGVQVAPAHDLDGTIYGFAGWSDGGDRVHSVETTDEPLALTVTLEPRSVLAAEFTGSNAVEIGDIEGLAGNMTLEFWMQPADFTEWVNPLAKAYAGEGAITQVDRNLVFLQGEEGGNREGWENFGFVAELVEGEWTHVVLTRSGRRVVWYLDGELRAQKRFEIGASDSPLPLLIGNGYSNGYVGRIDEVAVYDRALSAREIAAHYRAIGDPESYRQIILADEPLGYWRLDEITGEIAADETGNWPGIYVGNPILGQEGAS